MYECADVNQRYGYRDIRYDAMQPYWVLPFYSHDVRTQAGESAPKVTATIDNTFSALNMDDDNDE